MSVRSKDNLCGFAQFYALKTADVSNFYESKTLTVMHLICVVCLMKLCLSNYVMKKFLFFFRMPKAHA